MNIQSMNNNDISKFCVTIKQVASDEQLYKTIEKEIEQIWNRFSKTQSEIDRNRDIVNYFVYLKDDELMSDFPKDCLDVLTKSITFIRSALEYGNYDRSKERLYRLTVEEGLRIVNTSTFFETI